MGKIAVMMSVARPEARMSSHFGMAKWMMLADGLAGRPEFVRNEQLNGRGMAEMAIGHGCSDVIVVDLGDGALRHLQQAGINAWAAPGVISGTQALELFARGELARVPAPRAEVREKAHGGCCCGAHGGRDSSMCCGS